MTTEVSESTLKRRGIMVESVAAMVTYGVTSLEAFTTGLQAILNEEMWRQRIIPQTKELTRVFESFEEFVTTDPLEGLGTSVERLRHLAYDNKSARAAIERETDYGQGSRTDKLSYNITKSQRGTSEIGALRRLRKDRPDLHARVLASELSAHAAMIKAGFRPATITIRLDDATKAVAVLRKHFTRDQLLAALDEKSPSA